MIRSSVLDLAGNTPMVYFSKLGQECEPVLAAKLEMYNPTMSIKDRPALYMIKEAEE